MFCDPTKAVIGAVNAQMLLLNTADVIGSVALLHCMSWFGEPTTDVIGTVNAQMLVLVRGLSRSHFAFRASCCAGVGAPHFLKS